MRRLDASLAPLSQHQAQLAEIIAWAQARHDLVVYLTDRSRTEKSSALLSRHSLFVVETRSLNLHAHLSPPKLHDEGVTSTFTLPEFTKYMLWSL